MERRKNDTATQRKTIIARLPAKIHFFLSPVFSLFFSLLFSKSDSLGEK
jgi:hypothetical protein